MKKTKRLSRRGYWFLSYCVITLISIVINMIGYGVAQQVIRRDLEKNSLNSLKSMQQIYDNHFQEIFNASYNILQSYSVNRLSAKTQISLWQEKDCIINVSKDIKNVMYGNNSVEECILIINNKNMGISSTGSTDVSSIYDIYFKEYYDDIEEWKYDMTEAQGKKLCFLKDSKGGSVLYLVYGMEWVSSDHTALIKINTMTMNSYLENSSEDGEEYYITDLDGNTVFAGIEPDSGGFSKKNSDDIVTSINSDFFELKYNKSVPGNVYFGNIRYVRNFFVLSYLLCIVTGCLIAYWFSGVLERRQKKAEEILAEKEKLLRRNKLKQLLNGEADDSEAAEWFGAYQSELYRDGYVVVLFEFAESKETEIMTAAEYDSLCKQTETSFKSELPGELMFFCDINKNCVGIIKLSDGIDAASMLCMHCRAVIDKLESLASVSAICSMSRVFYDTSQIHAAYEQTEEIINFCFFGDNKKVIIYDELSEHDFSYDAGKEKRLINCVLCGEKDEVLKIIDDIYSTNENKEISIGTMRVLTFQLINSVMLAKEHSVGGESDYRKLYRLFLDISEMQRVDELKNAAAVSISGICNEEVIEMRSDNSEKYRNIINYIEENYTNQLLNVNMIADVFRINRSWLSEVFKKKFGEGIADYIVKYRLEKAKEMLKDGVIVNKVAEECGFSSAVVFTRAFKKFEGITPGQYKTVNAKNSKTDSEEEDF